MASFKAQLRASLAAQVLQAEATAHNASAATNLRKLHHSLHHYHQQQHQLHEQGIEISNQQTPLYDSNNSPTHDNDHGTQEEAVLYSLALAVVAEHLAASNCELTLPVFAAERPKTAAAVSSTAFSALRTRVVATLRELQVFDAMPQALQRQLSTPNAPPMTTLLSLLHLFIPPNDTKRETTDANSSNADSHEIAQTDGNRTSWLTSCIRARVAAGVAEQVEQVRSVEVARIRHEEQTVAITQAGLAVAALEARHAAETQAARRAYEADRERFDAMRISELAVVEEARVREAAMRRTAEADAIAARAEESRARSTAREAVAAARTADDARMAAESVARAAAEQWKVAAAAELDARSAALERDSRRFAETRAGLQAEADAGRDAVARLPGLERRIAALHSEVMELHSALSAARRDTAARESEAAAANAARDASAARLAEFQRRAERAEAANAAASIAHQQLSDEYAALSARLESSEASRRAAETTLADAREDGTAAVTAMQRRAEATLAAAAAAWEEESAVAQKQLTSATLSAQAQAERADAEANIAADLRAQVVALTALLRQARDMSAAQRQPPMLSYQPSFSPTPAIPNAAFAISHQHGRMRAPEEAIESASTGGNKSHAAGTNILTPQPWQNSWRRGSVVSETATERFTPIQGSGATDVTASPMQDGGSSKQASISDDGSMIDYNAPEFHDAVMVSNWQTSQAPSPAKTNHQEGRYHNEVEKTKDMSIDQRANADMATENVPSPNSLPLSPPVKAATTTPTKLPPNHSSPSVLSTSSTSTPANQNVPTASAEVETSITTNYLPSFQEASYIDDTPSSTAAADVLAMLAAPLETGKNPTDIPAEQSEIDYEVPEDIEALPVEELLATDAELSFLPSAYQQQQQQNDQEDTYADDFY